MSALGLSDLGGGFRIRVQVKHGSRCLRFRFLFSVAWGVGLRRSDSDSGVPGR